MKLVRWSVRCDVSSLEPSVAAAAAAAAKEEAKGRQRHCPKRASARQDANTEPVQRKALSLNGPGLLVSLKGRKEDQDVSARDSRDREAAE